MFNLPRIYSLNALACHLLDAESIDCVHAIEGNVVAIQDVSVFDCFVVLLCVPK